MKKLVAACCGIAAAAVLLSFRFARGRHEAARNLVLKEPPPQAQPNPEQSRAPFADDLAKGGTPASIIKNPPGAEPGVTLNVQGLAPIPLTGRNGAPSEKTVEAVTGRADLSDTTKARALIELLPTLPPEALARAAEEAATRLSDTDYTAALRPTLIAPQTHGMAMSVLFADLMQRPDSVSLPILATIAQDPKHPYSQNARENLQFLLGQDFGNDWARWNEAIRNRIGSPEK